jgi:hypothetical protein
MSSKNNLRGKWFRVRIVLAVCAAVVVVAYSEFCSQPIIAQVDARSRSEAGDLECISYCSTTRPGTVVMEVKMRLGDVLLNEADLQAKIRQQSLEVTVYADGFERGLFAAVSTLKPQSVFRAGTRAGKSAVQSKTKIPGLERLVITNVGTRLSKAKQSLLLMQPPTQPADEGEWVTVRLEGLDPDMAYTFRVPGRQSIVTCQAVVCPVDMVPTSPKQAKRKSERQPGTIH